MNDEDHAGYLHGQSWFENLSDPALVAWDRHITHCRQCLEAGDGSRRPMCDTGKELWPAARRVLDAIIRGEETRP